MHMVKQAGLSLVPLFLAGALMASEAKAQPPKPEGVFGVPPTTGPVWQTEKTPLLSFRLKNQPIREKERLPEIGADFLGQTADNRSEVAEGVYVAFRPNRVRVTIPFGVPRN